MSFQSPQLLVPEIVTAFQEYNIDVSEHDFRQPDPRRWREIYATMYEAMTERSIESAIQSMLKETRLNSTTPEAFEEAADQMAFAQCLQKVMSTCGYKDFSLKDVIRPSPKGVRRIGSVFINKTRHDTRVLDFFYEIQERAQKSQGEYESVLRRNKELNQRQSMDEANRVHRKAELQKLEDEVENGNKALTELKGALEEERRCGNDYKLKISEWESNKASLKQVFEQKNQECEKLSRKIVQSPKKFQIDLDRLKKKVVDLNSQFDKEEQVSSESRLLLEQTTNKTDAAARAVKLAVEVQTDLDKVIEISSELQVLAEKQADLQEGINSCFTQEEDLAERFRVRQAQRHTQNSHSDLKQQSDLQKMADFKRFADKLNGDMMSILDETSAVKDKLAQLKLQIASEVEDKVTAEEEDLQKEENRLIQMIEMFDVTCEKDFTNYKRKSLGKE